MAKQRMPIKDRLGQLLNLPALDGSLNDGEFRDDENFGFEVPISRYLAWTSAILIPFDLGLTRAPMMNAQKLG